MNLRATGENAYFAASNSAEGFCSRYKDCFDAERIDHVYIIKGGPGTGKSRMMREAATYAEGGGYTAEYIYCSSDPTSLDGVILSGGGRCVAIVDGTAPHVYDAAHPGVREELVDLGRFWEADCLIDRKDEIEALTKLKSEGYRRGYRFLSAYGELAEERDTTIRPYVRHAAIVRAAERLTGTFSKGDGFEGELALQSSIGMQGAVMLDTFLSRAETLYVLKDCHGVGAHFLRAIVSCAMHLGLAVRLSYDPILPDRLDGVFFVRDRVSFVIAEPSECAMHHKALSMRHYVDLARMRREHKSVTFCERLQRTMLQGVTDAMEEVKRAHFALEEIYSSAMDFEAKGAFAKAFIKAKFPPLQ